MSAITWFLSLHPFIAIAAVSVIITLLTTLAYKYLSDQKRIKTLKADMKKLQEKMKKTKDSPEKMMKVQKDIMEKNLELMKLSFTPTLWTLVPVILIFGWMNAHMAFEPLHPDAPFTVETLLKDDTTGNVTLSAKPDTLKIHKDDTLTKTLSGEEDPMAAWTLMGPAGEYELAFTHNGKTITKDIIITDENGEYKAPLETYGKEDRPFKTVTLGNEKIKPMAGVPLIGNWGWIGTYILLSLALSFGFRKMLDVA